MFTKLTSLREQRPYSGGQVCPSLVVVGCRQRAWILSQESGPGEIAREEPWEEGFYQFLPVPL